MTRRTRALALIVIGLVLVLVARETGAIDLRLGSSRGTSTRSSQIQGSDVLARSNVRLEYVHGDEHHLRALAQTSGEPIAVTARVARFEVSGSTWTPLVKWVHVEFHVDITSSDPRVAGSIDGTIDRSARGFLSSRAFRAGLRDQVRELVLKTLMA